MSPRQSVGAKTPPVPPQLRSIDWGSIAPLRLRARAVAEGVYAGAHRSLRRGPGVEFGGHREYVPGDDLRWLDRRALLRHDKLIVREFETETDRGLRLIVDASASMGFRGREAPGRQIRLRRAHRGGAARVALASGDPVGLDWLGGQGGRALPARPGREAFERMVGALESVEAAGDLAARRGLDRARRSDRSPAKRGAAPSSCSFRISSTSPHKLWIGSPRSRPTGASWWRFKSSTRGGAFPFEGTVRLRALEGGAVIETDADTTRARYLAALQAIADEWSHKLTNHGGQLLRAQTD